MKSLWQKLRKEKRLTIRCVTCKRQAFMTDWEPPLGLNNSLREFLCSRKHLSYSEKKVNE